MLKAAKLPDGNFDFTESFSALKGYLSEADYVVGNFETVCAGEKLGYNPGPLTYNSPDVLLETLKKVGITMLTTANNHCLDCGGKGVDRTIQQMDRVGIEHTGTTESGREGQKRFLTCKIGNIHIAFVSLTDAMNPRANGTAHSYEEWNQVNNIRMYKSNISGKIGKEILKKILPMNMIKIFKAKRMRRKGIPLVKAYTDDYDIQQEDYQQILWAKELLKQARLESDYVIACIHCGGQFNAEPGRHSIQLYDELEPYADAIIGNHPHVIQKIEVHNGKVRAYSLGSVNMSCSGDYVSKEFSPEFSVILNLYLDKEREKRCFGILQKITFTILKTEESSDGYVFVYPVDEEYFTKVIQNNQDLFDKYCAVYLRFTGKKFREWQSEYDISLA